MRNQKTKTIKKIVSWTLGIPAAFLIACEVEDMKYWWIQFVAVAVVAAILIWNKTFKFEEK